MLGRGKINNRSVGRLNYVMGGYKMSNSGIIEDLSGLTGSPEVFHRKFFTLLGSNEQRMLFYRIMKSPSNWPSTIPLFGVPPYQFLRQTDRDPVRASAIKKGAKRLSYNTDGLRKSGMPQYTSGAAGIRVLSRRQSTSRDGPCFLLKSGDEVVLELHISEKSERLSTRLELAPTAILSEMFAVTGVTVVVKRVLKASPSIALLAATVE